MSKKTDKLRVWSNGVWASDVENDIDDLVNDWLDTFDYEVVSIQHSMAFAESSKDMFHSVMITYKHQDPITPTYYKGVGING